MQIVEGAMNLATSSTFQSRRWTLGRALRLFSLFATSLLIGILACSASAEADQIYEATDNEDTIYFGYCPTCYQGGPGLLICPEGAASVTRPMDSGTLEIKTKNGNDTIKPISDASAGGCNFGDIDLLSFTMFLIKGGGGNDNI